MTFRQFALHNVRRNFSRYAAYFLSSTFAVTVFFMYAAFIFHPDVVNGTIRPSVRRGIFAAEVIVFLFSVFFIFYSTSSFLKLRKKDFGLLTLLGITRGQLNKLIIIENSIIALLSIATGMVFGALLTKIFFMMFSVMLDLPSPLSYYIAWKAVASTAIVFLVTFEAITIMTLITIRSSQIIDLLMSAKKPKKPPVYSLWLSLLAVICLAIGYYLAYTSNIMQAGKRVLPILLLVIIGTYFLYTQASIGLLRYYKKQKHSYYHGTNLITAAELTYKLKDNARILSMVTILTAVTFTSTGVLANLYFGKKAEAEARFPHAIALISKKEPKAFENKLQILKNTLRDEHIPFKSHKAAFIRAYNPKKSEDYAMQNLVLMRVTDYNRFADLAGQPHISLPANTAAYMHPTPDKGYEPIKGKQIAIAIKNSNETLVVPLAKSIPQPAINPSGFIGYMLVVPDHLYAKFHRLATEETIQYYAGISYKNWEVKTSVIKKLNRLIQKDDVDFINRLELFNQMKQVFSLMLFIGFFVSVLFFLAADSILYFKLYNDLEQDSKQYEALSKLGLTWKEMKQIAAKQVAILFFIPFVVATVHAGFAFKMLQNMVSGSVVKTSALVIIIFFVVQLGYYFLIRSLYTKKVEQVM
ncbi:FtsX-like permease family protein [Parageobacillus toebii NBRC 107807]|uniref:ABC transport system permease protein n=1 Tax=Parageobacillus toebii NBRC 107807 TaxID=1223503 RepID=A0A6G9J1K0_9BACL|nr:FtsX-like permease family protein [Parageobacillus toebii]MBB3868909.1 putative ABC transport system permease protein [Parageobacillus toebii NBRC 107807]QIQ32593.1 FtsX-like permease family protein [Parageobacillus toebii NBRC 107807]